MVEHLTIHVALTAPEFTYFCKCGESRVGETAISEHLNAMRFRSFTAAALDHRRVWILGREVQL